MTCSPDQGRDGRDGDEGGGEVTVLALEDTVLVVAVEGEFLVYLVQQCVMYSVYSVYRVYLVQQELGMLQSVDPPLLLLALCQHL